MYIYIYKLVGSPSSLVSLLSSLVFRLSSQTRVGDGGDGDGGDGRIFPEHPSPILHAPRDIISRKGKSLTPIR